MSTQDRLLSDEELPKYLIRNYSISNGEANHLAHFINTQKRLYAESVIGDNETLMGNVTGNYCFQADKDDLIKYGNQVRAEQRERIK